MEIPGVSIVLATGQIGGGPSILDRIVGLIATGEGAVALLTPFAVVSLADAIDKGFTEAAEPNIYRHLKEFYDVAPIGTTIYVMAVANTESITSILDKTNANGAARLLSFAGGDVKVLGVARTPAAGYVPTAPAFIDSDATSALVNAKGLVQEYQAKIMPLRVLIGARVHDVNHATVFDPSAQDNNTAGLVVGGTLADGSASVGLALGKIAAGPPHRNIGRVKDGALPVQNMYIGTKQVKEFASLGTLIQKGYITFQTYPQKAGFFISDDPMATGNTDDYKSLTHCRVIDKATIIAFQTYLEELKDDVDLDSNGSIAAIDLKHLEAVITNNIMLGMSDSISGEPQTFIDPAQNLIAGAKLQVKLRLVPKGYLKQIEVELGFTNPANQ